MFLTVLFSKQAHVIWLCSCYWKIFFNIYYGKVIYVGQSLSLLLSWAIWLVYLTYWKYPHIQALGNKLSYKLFNTWKKHFGVELKGYSAKNSVQCICISFSYFCPFFFIQTRTKIKNLNIEVLCIQLLCVKLI